MTFEITAFEAKIAEQANKLIERAQALESRTPKAKGRPIKSLDNTVIKAFQRVAFDEETKWPSWMDNILHGVCNLDWYRTSYTETDNPSGVVAAAKRAGLPLSKHRLRKVFTYLPKLDTISVGNLLKVDKRQAERYMRAARLALPHLERDCPKELLEDVDEQMVSLGLQED